jgi:transposase, IS30 family
MCKGKTLSNEERSEIFILKQRKCSNREIAKALGRSPNTIGYEIKENSTNSVYDPKKAKEKARLKQRFRRLDWQKIEKDKELKRYIVAGLEKHQNPDEVSGRMRLEKRKFYASSTTIYDWLRSPRGQRYCVLLPSKRKRVRKHANKTKRVMIPNKVSIRERPLGSTNRTRYGHFEEDTIVSKKNGSKEALSVFSERKSKLITAKKVASLSPRVHAEIVKKVVQDLRIKSLSLDNGIENKRHAEYGVPSFFCDSYASWQKGGVENANKMIRRYFPKGTDWKNVSQEEIDRVVFIINSKPRKSLGYRTAFEVSIKAGIIKSEGVLIGG